MNNVQSKLENGNSLYQNESVRCTKCNSISFESIVSETNSIYQYCTNCNFNKKDAFKHSAIDAILNSIQKNLTATIEKSKSTLKLEVVKNNDTINVLINNQVLHTIKFAYDFSNIDIYFLENTIADLVEDIYYKKYVKADILVCV